MDLFGSFALLLAFLCGVYAFVGGIAAIITRRPLLIKSARNAGMAVCVLIWLGFGSLAYLFLTDNFSMAYVVEHSNRTLPAFFKFAAIWAGQQGSLLFWSFLLSIYIFSVLFTYRGKHPELMPYVGVVMVGVQLFFLTLNNFIASPFGVLGSSGPGGAMQWIMRGDGNGLNPLLQYPEMVIHPPILYSGYTGFTIPFAFALAALLGRYPGEKWIHLTRRWTMIAWGFQGVGILLGAHWAYAVLGWGGYWMWDPVENASLMPWLTGTAFLHSVMMQEKRGMMRVWNVWLVFVTFLLTIFGTFLTRSGVVNSVHAFAQSTIGPWFLGFIGLALLVCFVSYWRNRDYLRSDNTLDSLVSRESSFLFNNLILLVACVAVISGTLFPVLSEWVRGTKISVGVPFFNTINLPIALFLLFLTGVGPLLAWRKTSMASLRKNFGWPLLTGIVAGAIGVALGLRGFYVVTCLTLSVFVTLTILLEFYRGARVIASRGNTNIFSGVSQLTMRNTRRYGGYIVHFGIVLIFIGISGTAFNQDKQAELPPGAQMTIGPYRLTHQTFDSTDLANYKSEKATIAVDKGGKQIIMLYPEKRMYPANQESGTMVAIYSTLKEDLYVVYAGHSPETNQPVIHAYLNPLVKWIWLGGAVMVLGTLLAMLPNRQPVLALRTAAEPSRAGPALSPSPAPIQHYDGHD
ncbi:MAG TPA: heme lyase CcmF/NrfE family subunit [Candidatus Acidoferrales bacterium]|nr:heme lyase CcmF/NrfE family subunit [Candidatus Acidoferrales bacterium]